MSLFAYEKPCTRGTCVLTRKPSPMWAYNWLHLIRGSEPTTQMLHTLLTWVPWGIQYIEDVNPANSEALIEQIKLKPENKWWEAWLERYLEKRTQNGNLY